MCPYLCPLIRRWLKGWNLLEMTLRKFSFPRWRKERHSVEWLLKDHPNIVNCPSSYETTSYYTKSCTALSVAYQKGNVEMVNLLLQYNASVDLEDKCKRIYDLKELVASIYEGYDDDDSLPPIEDYEEEVGDDVRYKPIHHAILGNNPEILRLLLEKGASPNDIDQDEETPLHFAVRNEGVECARILLADQRCDPNLKDRFGETALLLAVKSPVQSFEMFKLFHATGNLKINEENYKKLLPATFYWKNLGAAKFLLSCPEGKELAKGILDLNYGDTLLHSACSNDEMAKLFLSNVNDDNGKPWGINKHGCGGRTPLMIVIKRCNYELIEYLIKAGENLQATDKKGETAFYYAALKFRDFKNPFWVMLIDESSLKIFKLYNELNTKLPGGNLCPIAALLIYLAMKGGIPKYLTLPDLKKTHLR